MTNDVALDADLDVLQADRNLGYLPKPIPTSRDLEIGDLISRRAANRLLANLQRSIDDGHAMVLRAFAERMASAAVRDHDATQLRQGLIGLLLTMGGPDTREGLTILPLFFDAMTRLQLVPTEFAESVRQEIGDRMAMPYAEFLRGSDKTIESMGYRASSDEDGFRYQRDW